MKRNDGPVSDEMVDVYRAIISGKSDIATKPATPGVGVDPRKAYKPSKRLRNWHRQSGMAVSLKTYARAIENGTDSVLVAAWRANKKAVR